MERQTLSNVFVVDRKINQGFFIEPEEYSEVYIKVQSIDGVKVTISLSSKNPVKFALKEDQSMYGELEAEPLALSLKVDQTLVIYPDTENHIEITIIRTKGNKRAKFGICDPLKRLVLREELLSTPPNPTTTAA